MRVRLVFLLLLVLVVVVPPASARTSEDATVDAIVALQAEVMLLVELGAFERPTPPVLAGIHDEWLEYVDGLEHGELVQWLIDQDAAGKRALDEMLSSGLAPPPATVDALRLLPDRVLDLLEAGGDGLGLPAETYVQALRQLERGIEPSSGAPVASSPTTTTTTSTTTMAVSASTLGSADPTPPPGTSAWLWMGGLAFTTTALGAVVARRGSKGGGGDVSFDRLLEAGRRMTRALDTTEIARIAQVEAAALAGAAHAAYVQVTPEGMSLVAEPNGVFDHRRLDEGALQRVADTGQTVNIVTTDEPAITSLPASLLAVPVIGGGRVTGILVLIRPQQPPFSDREVSQIGKLAPMVGSAIAATEHHDDLALTDSLTRLPNRRRLDMDLADFASVGGKSAMLAVAMVDVDHFKRFNDTHGHAAGDQALQVVAQVLHENVRAHDRAYRYGGEEFSLLLTVETLEEASAVAERVRSAVEKAHIEGITSPLTVSIGLAGVNGDAQAALNAADAALYTAKSAGRNRIVVAAQN